MPLDERDKQEIKALVAEEINQVLRREMAHWWAESILALSGYPPHGAGPSTYQGSEGGEKNGGGAGESRFKTKTVRPRPVGRFRPPAPALDAGGPASPPGDGRGLDEDGDPPGVEYLTGVVESLLRIQESLAQELQASMKRLEGLVRASQQKQGQ